jgi:hypothetical protein
MSVRLSARVSAATTGLISVKFDIADFFFVKMSRDIPSLVEIGHFT